MAYFLTRKSVSLFPALLRERFFLLVLSFSYPYSIFRLLPPECYANRMIDRIRTVSWYVFVFLLPWQTVWIVREVFVGGEKWQYATAGLYVSDVALLLCAVFFLFGTRREVWRGIVCDRVVLLLGVLFVWALLSSVWAVDANLAFLSAWRLLLMTLAFVFARYGDVSIRKTLLVFLVSMALQAMLAISQWVGQYVAPSTLLGVAEHDPAQWGTFVLKTESGRFLRAYGGFEHPNVLGGALAVALLFGVWLSATAKRIFSRAVFLGMTAIMSFSPVFTFSRSGWMAFGIGVFFFLILSSCCSSSICSRGGSGTEENTFSHQLLSIGAHVRKSIFSCSFWLSWLRRDCLSLDTAKQSFRTILVITILSFSIAFFLVRDIALSRFSEATLAREGSLSDRAMYLEQALVAIREHSILGVGGGNFTAFTRECFPNVGIFVGAFQPVHTVPILICAELGVVGFLLFLLVLLLWFSSAWRNGNMLSLAVFSLLLPILFLDHWIWSGHFGMVFFGFLLGVCRRMDLGFESVIPSARSRSSRRGRRGGGDVF